MLLKCNVITFCSSVLVSLIGAYTTFYAHLYNRDSLFFQIVSYIFMILVLIIFICLLYWQFYWFRLVAIRQKSYFISYSRLSFSEKKYFFITVPNTALFLYRGIWFFVNIQQKFVYWQTQTETSLIVDSSVQLVYIFVISSE